jgi:murein DD-endopeptidase MepM/ murein hydrolase activator NlpD
VAASVGDGFGPRGDRMHAGVDFTAPSGTPVAAARSGTVVRAGWDPSGFGNVVVLRHGSGVQTLYAHLSSIAVRQGQAVGGGALIGRVGSSGRSTGPHLHFEVLHHGANVDPRTAMR